MKRKFHHTHQSKSSLALPLIFSIFAALSPGCGTETGNPGDENESLIMRNSASLQAGAHLLEVSDSLEDSSNQSASLRGIDSQPGSLSLSHNPAVNPLTSYYAAEKTCITEGPDAVVERSRSVTKPFRFTDRQGRTVESNLEKNTESTIRLSRRDGIPVTCNPTGKFPLVSEEAYRNLNIAGQFQASVNRQFSVKSTSGEIVRQSSSSVNKKGTRSIIQSVVSEGTDDEFHIREITSSIEQGINATKENQSWEVTSTVETETNKPLVLALKKSGPLQPWTEARIQSGSLAAKLPDGTRTVTSFDTVVIQRSSPCFPESGSIKGVHFKEDDGDGNTPDEALLTYEITFEDGTSWISFNGEESKEELPFDLCSTVD